MCIRDRVSCYNALPVGGGASTLVRLNLREVAARSRDTADFLTRVLPHYMGLAFDLMRARIDYLYNQSHFFDGFLVTEGWIAPDRFTAMYGVFAMAEAVNLLQQKAGLPGRYGIDAEAIALGLRISETLAARVEACPMENVWRGRAMPVSYTHLDVYKRQVPFCGCCSRISSRPARWQCRCPPRCQG